MDLFSKIYYDIIMFSSQSPREGCLSDSGLLFTRLPLNKKHKKKRKKAKGREKPWLCANRTQRHSETLDILLFCSESGD